MAWPARAAIGAGVVLGVVVLAATVGLSGGALAQSDDASAEPNGSFGTQVATFMQSTAAEANASVEQGMWRESIEDRDDPDAAVHARAQRLEAQLTALEDRSNDLVADGGPNTSVAYTARASALRTRLASIRESVDETSTVARRHGVDDAALDTVRRRAANASGPAVAAAARNLTDAGRGPPEWVTERRTPGGPPGAPGPDRANGTAAGPGNRGPPGDRGDPGPSENRGAGGPPDGGGPAPNDGDDPGRPSDGGPGGPPNGDPGGPPGDGDDGGASGPAGSSGGSAGSGGGPAGSGDGSDGGEGGSAGSGGGPAGSGGGAGGPPA